MRDLALLLDAPDAFEQMRSLPAFIAGVDWATRVEDVAIGNWTAEMIGRDHESSVRAALAAVCAVRGRMPDAPLEELAVDPAWLDVQIRAIEIWLDDRADPHATFTAGTIDVTRQTSAWHDFDVVDGWIGEASDFAIQSVEIAPALAAAGGSREPWACAVLAAICATRALVLDGETPEAAVLAIARAIREGLGRMH